MRYGWMGVAVLILAAGVDAQITRTATFENYVAGTDLGTSFTDPLSGIFFSNPTSTNDKFGIGHGLSEFAGGNDLSNGPGGVLAAYFGFTANLPLLSDQVSIDIAWVGTPPGSSGINLEGFSGANASGILITQQSLSGQPDPYVLSILSSQYNIASIQVVVSGGEDTAYDNISYTYFPEPASTSILFVGIGLLSQRRNRRSG